MKCTLLSLLFLLAACGGNMSSTETTTTSTPSNGDIAIPATADSVLTVKQSDGADTTATKAKKLSTSANNTTAEDNRIIESFAQSGEGRNCASISVIKLAIRRYGLEHVFSKVDSSTTGFQVTLQDGKTVSLSRKELGDVSKFADFRLVKDVDTYKAAKFMYAVMAKNKFLTDNDSLPNTWPSLTSIVNQRNKYHLLDEDTDNNFTHLGLENNYVGELPIEDAYSKPSVIVASCYHSAFGGAGHYDEYGDVESTDNFARNHRGLRKKCSVIQWVYQLK
jgi:hypothetical protein